MGLFKKFFGNKSSEDEPEIVSPPPPPEPEPEPFQINEISAHDLKTRLDNGDDLVVVDMRQGWEYQSGHIPGATHIFIQEIPMRLQEIPRDKDVVFQCWHGNTSLSASAYLIDQGWEQSRIFSLSGGIAGWASAFGQEGLVRD